MQNEILMILNLQNTKGDYMDEKIIVVNYTGRKGGGAVYAYEMTKSLLENNCKIYAIISKDIENLKQWQELQITNLILLNTYTNNYNYFINTIKFIIFGVPKLKKYFKNIKVDALYIPMIQPWSSLINTIFKDIQKIITVHDPKPHSGSNMYINYLAKKTINEADDIIILSKTFNDYIRTFFNKKEEFIHVIPHGIFDYYKKVEASTDLIEYDPTKFNFLFFGRIEKYKGLHILAKAYEKLSNEFANISLSVVGNGNFDDYRSEFSELKNVTIVNRWIKDEEVGAFFKGDKIITVLPYIDATQSGIIPIAMDYESIVIASNTGGLSEQIEDNKTGYLFETENPDDLYVKMKYVINNYENQKHIIKNAKKYISSLSWSILGAQLKTIIK
jgi:glycosyltransferase involved in cell wall biosynthesis